MGAGEAVPVLGRKLVPAQNNKAIVTASQSSADMSLYARYALAGAFCCAFTHAILTPVDV